MTRTVWLLLAFSVACDRGSKSAPATPPAPATSAVKAPAPAHPGPIHWVVDDWAEAQRRALAENKPIVVDAWTKWCHTCLSMRSFVLSDPSMAAVADRFVWLALDYEALDNAATVEKFPATAYPTFFVIDPKTETVVSRWLGSASHAQFRAFVSDGERAMAMAHAAEMPANDPLAALVQGDRAATAGKHEEAAKHYAKALELAPADWARRPDALVSQVAALSEVDAGKCVDVALANLDRTGNTASASDFLAVSLGCAAALPKEDPRPAKLRAAAEPRLAALVADTNAPLSADDRGDAYAYLAELRKERGDEAGARATHEARVKMLEEAAAKAPDPASAMTFDWARSLSYLALDKPQAAIDLLLAREISLPQNYNPPAWLAGVYFRLGRYDEAGKAIDRALTRGDGPRKGGMYKLKADILEKQGNAAGAKQAVTEQIAWLAALPASQKRPTAEAEARKRLAAMP
jgi:thiol-disulfide isomerase/thioredoxin